MALVRISPRTLSWAISESGFDPIEIDKRLQLTEGTVEQWTKGELQPNRTQFKKLSNLLKRPSALFYMRSPPKTSPLTAVKMRYGFGAEAQSRSPTERVAIRDATRLRDFMSVIREELETSSPELFSASQNEDPEHVATRFREEYLRVSVDEQMAWTSLSNAFKEWRILIENLGILVFLYSLGEESARGFSIAEEHPPVIAVSRSWHHSVRIYTLFHEVGHILTKTSSSCIEDSSNERTKDPIERWCESFSAAVLMPRSHFYSFSTQSPHSSPIDTARWLATKYHVSRKAALLRLIEVEKADWQDFRELNTEFEKRQKGGGGRQKQKRTRNVIGKEKYGSCLSIVHEAFQKDVVNETDIRSHFNLFPEELI